MKRLVFSSTVLMALLVAVAARAAGPRAYKGPIAGVVLKQNKNVVKSAGAGPPVGGPGLPLQCDEGATRERDSFIFEGHPKVKNGKFHLAMTVVYTYETIDESGTVVSRDKAPFNVVLRGKFKPNYRKVAGTLTMTGSYFGTNGHTGTGPNGSDVQYHNCTGTVHWTAHKL